MKKILAALLVAAIVSVVGGIAGGASSPLLATHHLTKYEKVGKFATVGYTLHLVNAGEGALSNIVLSVVGSRFYAAKTVALKVATLPPGGSTDLSFQVEIPAAVPKNRLLTQPLFLSGKCLASTGKVIVFPAKSYPGGVP
jgi:hypothetical protein